MRKLIFLSILVVLMINGMAQKREYCRIKFRCTPQNIQILKTSSIASDEIRNTCDDSLQLEIDYKTAGLLHQRGLNYRTAISDLSKFYSTRNNNSELKNIKQVSTQSGLTPIPNGFELGTMGGFCTYNQMLAHLDTMHARFPNLISARQPISPLTTVDGNLIYSVKISNNPNQNEAEPSVLFTALTHAREPIGMQQMLFFMYHLLENYATDPYLKALIDTTQIVFIPCVNPDGYLYNQQTNPGGGGLWRKNRFDNGDGSFGIDLNRNFGYKWGYDDEGSSPVPSEETYRGTEAFSEPETQALRDYINQNQFQVCMNYHSYGNLLLYPFGYETVETADSITFRDFSSRITAFTGYSAGTAGALLYNTNGDAIDWMYGDNAQHPSIISMTPEVGNSSEDGFWPQLSRIIPLCQENVPGNIRAIELAGHYAEVTDKSQMYLSQNEGYMHFSFVRQGLAPIGTFTVSYMGDPSSEIVFGSPKTYVNPLRYDTISDSIWYQVQPSLVFPNKPVQFNITVSDGHISRTDTIRKIIGMELALVLDDPCETIDNWTSPNWNTTPFYAHSPIKSITDSPVGNYSSNTHKSIELTNSLAVQPWINPYAMLTFWIRRDIQRGRDYVVLEASNDDGITWKPLEGRYTRKGGMYQSIDTPLYDGYEADWVFEEIYLDEVDASLKFRFTITSDGLINKDGFWFDDFKVYTRDIYMGSENREGETGLALSPAWPNPAQSRAQIKYHLPNNEAGTIEIQNYTGQVLLKKQVNGEETLTIETNHMGSGVYLISLKNGEGVTLSVQKLVVQ